MGDRQTVGQHVSREARLGEAGTYVDLIIS